MHTIYLTASLLIKGSICQLICNLVLPQDICDGTSLAPSYVMKLLRDLSSRITGGWGGTFVEQPQTGGKTVNSLNQKMPNVSTSVLWQRVFWLWWWKLWVLLCTTGGRRCFWGALGDGWV